MTRSALLTATAASLLLLAACQSGVSSPGEGPVPAPAPERSPAPEPRDEDPAPGPRDEDPARSDGPAETASASPTERPEVVLEDGRDLMAIHTLPSRELVPTAELPAGDPTTRDGVYTLEQAARGAELVRATCAECHDPEDWRERGFLGRWVGESTFQLWYYINDRMPYRNPWSLSRQQVTDALAYILYVNELPPGEAEMGTDDDSIDDYWIVWDAAH